MKLLLKIILENKVKVTYLIILGISYYFAGTFKDTQTTYNYVNHTKYGTKYVYTLQKNTSFLVKEFDKEQKLINNTIVLDEYADLNVLFWILFCVSLILVVGASTLDDGSTGWDIKETYREHQYSKVRCVCEDNKYYYIFENRLIYATEDLNQEYKVKEAVDRCMLYKNLYPKVDI